MTKITGWALASAVIVVLGAACTTETTDTSDGGTSSGSAGSTSSSTSTGTGTGGSGGSSGDDGGACMASASASACEKCAFDKCMTETCACKAVTGCESGMDDYFMCLAALEGGDMTHCAEGFAGSAGGGAAQADTLAQCMETNCIDRCQGKDAGPRF